MYHHKKTSLVKRSPFIHGYMIKRALHVFRRIVFLFRGKKFFRGIKGFGRLKKLVEYTGGLTLGHIIWLMMPTR